MGGSRGLPFAKNSSLLCRAHFRGLPVVLCDSARRFQQIRCYDTERISQSEYIDQGDISLTTLHAPEVAASQTAFQRQALL